MAETTTTAQKLSAEVIGTFVLVFVGCGAALFSNGDYVATGFAFGLTVLVMVYAVGRVSGGHFNPAVSVGAAVGGRMSWAQVPAYVAAQLGGALLAGFLLFVLMHGFSGFDATGNMAQNGYGDAPGASGYAWWSAFILEMVMTAIFAMVILAVTDARNEHPALAPLTIGLALTMIHFASIGATGTSVNPARSIGVGVFAGTDAVIQLWLFIIAPLLGGVIAGASYAVLFGLGSEPVPGSGFSFSRPARGVPATAGVPGYGAPDQYQQEWNQENPAVQAQAQAAQAQQAQQVEQAQQAQAQQAQAQQAEAWGTEPIIENGWQWDPHSQQWIPAQQQPPSDGGDHTQFRPPGQ